MADLEVNYGEVTGSALYLSCITGLQSRQIKASRAVIFAIRTWDLSLSQQRAVSFYCTPDSHQRKSNFAVVLSARPAQVYSQNAQQH